MCKICKNEKKKENKKKKKNKNKKKKTKKKKKKNKKKKHYFIQNAVMFVKTCGKTELGVIIEHLTKTNRRQYKSINHIKNMLKCLQAKEWCDVPDEILNIVKNDLREGCLMSIIKLILKKHRLSQCTTNMLQNNGCPNNLFIK